MFFVVALTVFPLLFAVSAAADSCPPDWRYFQENNACYTMLKSDQPFNTQQALCRYTGVGSFMSSVANADENQFLRKLAAGRDVWLGTWHRGNTYGWVDLTPFGSFENWQGGVAPTEIKKSAQCVKLNVTTGTWYQSCCMKAAPAICKMAPLRSG